MAHPSCSIQHMKRCPRCQEHKPFSDFYVRALSTGAPTSYCKRCQNSYCKLHYGRYKTRHNRRRYLNKRACVKRNRAYMLQYLLRSPCVDCGEGDPVVLEFDHVTGEKITEVCLLAWSGCSLSQLRRKMLKCEVRCANCHRRKTARERSWYRFGA